MIYRAIQSLKKLILRQNTLLLSSFSIINNRKKKIDSKRFLLINKNNGNYLFSKIKQVNDYMSFHSDQEENLDQFQKPQSRRFYPLSKKILKSESLEGNYGEEEDKKIIINQSNKKTEQENKNKLASFSTYNDNQSVYTNIMKCSDSRQFSIIYSKTKPLFSPRLYSVAGKKLMTLIAQQSQRKSASLTNTFLEMFLLQMMRESPLQMRELYGPEQIKSFLLVIKRIKKRKNSLYKKLENNIIIFTQQLITLVRRFLSHYNYSELSQVFTSCVYLDSSSQSIQFYQNMLEKLNQNKIQQSIRKLYSVSHIFQTMQYVEGNQFISSFNQKGYQKERQNKKQTQNGIHRSKNKDIFFKKFQEINKQGKNNKLHDKSQIKKGQMELGIDDPTSIIAKLRPANLFDQQIRMENQKMLKTRYSCYEKSYQLYIDYLEHLNWKQINSNWINGDINNILDSYQGIHLTINKFGIQYLNIIQKAIQQIERQSDEQNKTQSQKLYQQYFNQFNKPVFKKIKAKLKKGKDINKQKNIFNSFFSNSSRVIKIHFILNLLSIRLEKNKEFNQNNPKKNKNDIYQKTVQGRQLINKFKRYSQQNLQQLMAQTQMIDNFKRNLNYFRKYKLIFRQQYSLLQNAMKRSLSYSRAQDQNNQKYWNF